MKITIQKFQQLYNISLVDADEIDKSTMLVECLTGKTAHEVNRMAINKFNKLCKQINNAFATYTTKVDNDKPKNIIRANGRWYWVNYDITNKPYIAGKYVEVATFKDDIIGNLHKLMATMVTPLKWSYKGLVPDTKSELTHKQISEDMLQLNFNVAYHSAVFFCAILMQSMNDSVIYSMPDPQMKMLVNLVQKNLHEVLDGCITAKWYQNLRVSV